MDRECFETYYPKIYNYVYYRVLNHQNAEDITSEVFYKAVACEGSYDEGRGAYSTWIFTIAKHCLLQFYRSKKPLLSFAGLSGYMEAVSDEGDPLEAACSSEEAEKLRRILSAMNEKERDVLALRFWGGLTYREIALHTGHSEKKVSVILTRALKKMRNILQTV